MESGNDQTTKNRYRHSETIDEKKRIVLVAVMQKKGSVEFFIIIQKNSISTEPFFRTNKATDVTGLNGALDYP